MGREEGDQPDRATTTRVATALVTIFVFVVAIFVLLAATAPPTAAEICGDGILDHFEECDEGKANGPNACCTTTCDRVRTDSDGDSVCDAEDPCPSPAPLFADATLTLRGLTPGANDTFRLTGTLAPSAAVDPAADGVVVLLANPFIGTLMRAILPGGTGWTRRRSGGWTYRDSRGAVAGLTRLAMKPINGTTGTLAVVVEGRHQIDTGEINIRPIRVAIALSAAPQATPDRCAEVALSPWRCSDSASGRTLRCTPPPQPRPCWATADARIRCDAFNAAAAQEAYYTTHASYYSGGPCNDLPGFTPSRDVLCVTTGESFTYVVTTSSPSATIYACVYVSNPPVGQPNLVCG